MTRLPLTLEIAVEIAEDFEALVDTDFKTNTVTYIIDNIVPAPFAEEDRQKFVKSYLETKDAQASLGLYNGHEFEVLLFGYDENDDTNYICIDIRSFTEQQGINYSFP